MNKPLISIVIAVKNAERTLRKCLDSVLGIDYENYEVIVVDDGSRDKTPEILKDYSAKVRLILNSVSLGPSKARNSACAAAKGEYLAFTDGDCIVDRNWLSELLQGFKESPVISVGGIQKTPEDESVFGKRVFKLMEKSGFVTDYVRRDKGGKIFVAHNASCNVMYRRDIFLSEGGFLEGFWPGEDVELDYRLKKLGYKLLFNPKAIVYHYRPGNLKTFCRMMYRYGYAQGFLFRKYGIFRKIQILPFLSLFVFITLFSQGILFFSAIALLGLLFLFLYSRFRLLLVILFLSCFFCWHLGFFLTLVRTFNNLYKKE